MTRKIGIFILSFILLNCGGANMSTYSSELYLTPTIYYLPVFEVSKVICADSDKKPLKNSEDKVLIDACSLQYKKCATQGSCYFQQANKFRLFNVSRRVGGEMRFNEIIDRKCPFGWGTHSTCIDPNYSVAADIKIYPVGTVIFVPEVRGLILENGDTHSGYFIVRDEGGGVSGAGRFDFNTGTSAPTDSKNILAHLGLGDPDNKFKYQIVRGSLANEILKSRNFPNLNSAVLDEGKKLFGD